MPVASLGLTLVFTTRVSYNARAMQKTLHALSSTSLPFLIVLGGLHMRASFLFVQDVPVLGGEILIKALDLPFLLVALIYGVCQCSLLLESIFGDLRKPLLICSIGASMVFLVALVINFGFPDVSV